jgi:hypothetical protein
VVKSGSVLRMAYLQSLMDQIINFIVALGIRPHDPTFAFSIGICGIVTPAIIVLLILRDPIRRGRGSDLASSRSGCVT